MPLLLLLFLTLPVYLPALGAIDPDGTRFLAIAVLNLLVFVSSGIFSSRSRSDDLTRSFFRTTPGMVYAIFVAVMLLSVFSAINSNAAWLSFVKVAAVFISAGMIFLILSKSSHAMRSLVNMLTVLLLIDSFAVFLGVTRFITGEISSIFDIQFVYTNKNILAAAIFVKMAAPLWLLFFTSGRMRNLGAAALLAAMLAIFFLSARAFYIGLAVMTLFLILFALIRYLRAGERRPAISVAWFAILLLTALAGYTVTQHYLYPRDRDTWNYNVSVTARVSEITTEVAKVNQPAGIRLSSWERTLRLIGAHPVAGVGAGNWKIAVLEYENRERPDFNYMLHNHNDFAEITAETGLAGGVLFIALFVIIIFRFFQAAGDQYLFFPAVGMMAYAVDAFFNYPGDRPEIQALFAVFLATGALWYGESRTIERVRALFQPAVSGSRNTTVYRESDLRECFQSRVSGSRNSEEYQESNLRECLQPGDSGSLNSEDHQESDLRECFQPGGSGSLNSEDHQESDIRDCLQPTNYGSRTGDQPDMPERSMPKTQRRARTVSINLIKTLSEQSFTALVLKGFVLIFLVMSVGTLALNYRSLRNEMLAMKKDAVSKAKWKTALFNPYLPVMPDITSKGEPVAVQKARILIRDGLYREAIALLQNDRSSPYDSRREYYLGKACLKAGMEASAGYWLSRAKALKPLCNFAHEP